MRDFDIGILHASHVFERKHALAQESLEIRVKEERRL